MEVINDKKDIVYVGYGIGCNYHAISMQVKKKIPLSYLCDKKWGAGVTEYDGIPVISQANISKIENAKVIIFPSDLPIKSAIARELQEMGVEYIFVEELLGKSN